MSMYKKLIGSLTISLLFLLSATPSFAQQNDVKVTGKITDGSGAPLAGVVVVVKDGKSNNGAVSNTQGVYEIKVPASSTLLFTCLGYTDQEVKLGASNVVNVTMTEDAQSSTKWSSWVTVRRKRKTSREVSPSSANRRWKWSRPTT